MNITEIIPQDKYVLCIKADDGTTGLFDVKLLLDSEAFSPLKDKHEFERIHSGRYFVEWDCGADLSADTIKARWNLLPAENMRVMAERFTGQTRRPSGTRAKLAIDGQI